MSQPKKVAAKPAVKPAANPKPPRRLTPRPAAAQADSGAAERASQAAPAAGPATAAASAKARPARKPSAVDASIAKHQKVLAEALVKAEAGKSAAPAVPPAPAKKPAKPEKAEKAPKARKPKLVRDSYAMPETEYARIGELKKRLAALGNEVKKSELLRGGIAVLAALDDAGLQAVMAGVERIKTGRPSK